MDNDVIWQSAFTIMNAPFTVSTIISMFPMIPVDSYNSDERVIHGDRRKSGLCEYRLSEEYDQSRFLTVLDAWLNLLEPYRAVFLQLHEEEYSCFLEIWTSDTYSSIELSYPLLQRIAALGIDLELRSGV